MACLFFIVFKFPVGAQKDSDRDGIRTHERKACWNSSPTPWPIGHPVAIYWQKPKIAAQKDSDRDGIRTRARKLYWISSPTP